jgi:hypothetical protein
MQQLHDSQINAGVETFYDAGMRVWLGDTINGIRGDAGQNERDCTLSRGFIRIGIRASKRKHQSLQLAGGPVDSLARIYFLNFNEPPNLASHRLDSEDAKSTVTNK